MPTTPTWKERFDEKFAWLRMFLNSPYSDFEGDTEKLLSEYESFLSQELTRQADEFIEMAEGKLSVGNPPLHWSDEQIRAYKVYQAQHNQDIHCLLSLYKEKRNKI